MKIRHLVLAVIAACLTSGAARGQSYEHDRYRGERHERLSRCDYSNPWAHERNHRTHRRAGGAGPCHDIHRGERLPRFYWHDRYQVRDWRMHDLPAPWRRHHWVRTGNDFALVNVHSGEVAKVILLRHRKEACRLHSQC